MPGFVKNRKGNALGGRDECVLQRVFLTASVTGARRPGWWTLTRDLVSAFRPACTQTGLNLCLNRRPFWSLATFHLAWSTRVFLATRLADQQVISERSARGNGFEVSPGLTCVSKGEGVLSCHLLRNRFLRIHTLRVSGQSCSP